MRKNLIIAGTLTSVCMNFPTLSALNEGYNVYTVVDASGNWCELATQITLTRVTQAGAIPTDTLSIISEILNNWNSPEGEDIAKVFGEHIMPRYGALMESYQSTYDDANNK